MLILKKQQLISKLIVFFFLFLIFARDILGLGIPLIVLTLVWCIGLLVWNDDERAAFTVAATICFANSVSITIPIFAFLSVIILKNGVVYKSKILYISLLIIVIEGLKFFQFSNQNIRLYVNYIMIILLVAIVVSFQSKMQMFDPVLILRYYLFFFVFLSLDILVLTIKNYGSFSAILGASFRIGQTDFVEGESISTMSINANGVGLLAILAVIIAFILLRYRALNRMYAYGVVIYASIIGFLTISKTFFIIYILMVVLLLIENTITYSQNPIKIIGIFGLIAVAFFLFSHTSIYSNIMLRFATGDLTTGRVDITKGYIDYMSGHSQYQLLGIGLQNVNIKVGMTNVPHNALLEIYVTLGIVGIIAYIVFFCDILSQAKKNNRNLYNRKIPFINMIPIIIFLIFIQALQFLRISYIYDSIILVVMTLLINYDEAGKAQKLIMKG